MFRFTLPYPEAIKIAKKLAHSVSKDENRPSLNGFFMHERDGKHYAVSTDGHMLTRIEINPQYGEQPDETAIMRIPAKQEAFPAVIFPALAIRQIEQIKLNPNNRGGMPVTFFIEQDGYRIECYDQIFVGKLIDGAFPDYQRVIPEGWQQFPNEYGKCGFSAIYIAAIMKAVSFCPEQFKATANPMRMFFSDGNPGVIQETRDTGILYVIMPIRTGMPEHWHVAPEQVAEAEESALEGDDHAETEIEPVAEPEVEPAADPEPIAGPEASPPIIQYRGYHSGPKDTGGMTSLYASPEDALAAAQRCSFRDETAWVNPEFTGTMDTVLRTIEPIGYIEWKPTPARKTIQTGETFIVGDITVADHQVTHAVIGQWLVTGKAEVA